MPTQAWYSIWLSWDETGKHLGWYVNFQEPFRRTEIGFQTMDLMLDLVVQPDGAWVVKDEGEFDELVSRTLIDAATEQRVRQEVTTVADMIESGVEPFNEEWVNWRPDPSWPVPELMDGWASIETA